MLGRRGVEAIESGRQSFRAVDALGNRTAPDVAGLGSSGQGP